MACWQLQDAKARFTEFLNTALKKGPQIVTRRGVETAVLVHTRAHPRLEAARTGRAAHFEEFAAWSWPLLSESSSETRRAEAPQDRGIQVIHYLLDTSVLSELRKPKAHGAVVSLAAKSSRRSDLYLRCHRRGTPARYRTHSKADRGQGSRNRNLARPNRSFPQPALHGRSLLSRMGPAYGTRVRASS